VSRESPDNYYRLSAEVRGQSKLYVIATEGYRKESAHLCVKLKPS
jgi:hypothetical protein